jgi:murein hydrolase activator
MKRYKGSNLLAYSIVVGWALLFTMPSSAWAQATGKKKELESKKQQLQKEIDYQNKLLNDVKKNKNRSMVQLAILNNKIARQKELIITMNREINVVEEDISQTKENILQKEIELQLLKDEYAKIVLATYRKREEYSFLMFLFASHNFNQAINRIKYLQYYNEARKKQAALIDSAQHDYQTKKIELETKKAQQTEMLSQQQKETGNLSKEKKSKEVLLTDLQSKEKSIKEEIKTKKEQAEKLRRAIEKVINEEIKKAQLASKTTSKKISITPDEKLMSDDFESNRGKLPWPVTEGVITEEFGTHDHPDMPGIKISNNGVDIGTHKGASVRAVFAGSVVAVASVGGLEGKVIIVKHGEYLSVYSNLQDAFVKSGEKVKIKQPIGTVLTGDDAVSELHFEVWKGQLMLDPEGWIAKKN